MFSMKVSHNTSDMGPCKTRPVPIFELSVWSFYNDKALLGRKGAMFASFTPYLWLRCQYKLAMTLGSAGICPQICEMQQVSF